MNRLKFVKAVNNPVEYCFIDEEGRKYTFTKKDIETTPLIDLVPKDLQVVIKKVEEKIPKTNHTTQIRYNKKNFLFIKTNPRIITEKVIT